MINELNEIAEVLYEEVPTEALRYVCNILLNDRDIKDDLKLSYILYKIGLIITSNKLLEKKDV